MKHSTNYFHTLIEIAEDSPIVTGEVPPMRGDKKSVATLQYEMLAGQPYKHTSDDILFTVFALRKEIPEEEWEEQRSIFFSKGQPCFRASPLTKRYGWGIHSNAEGKVAMLCAESDDYRKLQSETATIKTKAMRSKRA